MKDRIPTPGQEGRVQIEYEDGTKVFVKISMADNPTEQGTPLATATLLKDATAALFGKDRDAVPDDVLAWVGKHNLHWWRRRAKIVRASLGTAASTIAFGAAVAGSSAPLSYSNTVVVDPESFDISLGEPVLQTSPEIGYSTPENAQVLVGNYFIPRPEMTEIDKIYYCTAYEGAKLQTSGDYRYTVLVTAQRVSVETTIGEWEYVQADNANAFPVEGVVDDVEYQYLGIPFDNAVNAPKTSFGYYEGTGVAGSDNPNRLTFDFLPEMVMLLPEKLSETDQGTVFIRNQKLSSGIGDVSSSANASSNTVSWEETTVSWYATSTAHQYNKSGVRYRYFAIG